MRSAAIGDAMFAVGPALATTVSVSALFEKVVETEIKVLGNRVRLHTGGSGNRALLLLHGGWGGAAMHWSRVWDQFAQRSRVVAPDLPGLGDLTQTGSTSLAGYASWLEAMLDALSISQVVCVGNSFGASLAYSFGGRHSDRCVGVVMVNGVPMPRTPAPMLWLGSRSLGRGIMRSAVKRLSFTPDRLQRAFVDFSAVPSELKSSLRKTPRLQLDTFVDCLVAGDGSPPPRAPVLILWGAEDRLPGTRLSVGKKLATRLPDARWVALAHAGHFPQLEQPSKFVDAVEAFVKEC